MTDIKERCSECGAYLDGWETGEGVLCPGEAGLDHFPTDNPFYALTTLGWNVDAEVITEDDE